MPNRKKKNAFGWWQKFSSGDPEKNAEIFNHNMGADNNSSEASGEVSGTAMAEAVNDIVNNPENNLEAMRALREENVDSSNGVSYRNGSFYKGDMEVVSDNPDELPDEEESKEKISSVNSGKLLFRVTVRNSDPYYIRAKSIKRAMAIYKSRFGSTDNVMGIHAC